MVPIFEEFFFKSISFTILKLMQPKYFYPILILFLFTCQNSKEKLYNLNWNIPQKEYLGYSLIISELDFNKIDTISLGIGDILGERGLNSLKKSYQQSPDLFLGNFFQDTDIETYFLMSNANKKNIIDISLYLYSPQDSSKSKSVKIINTLRGKVNYLGGIESFYLQNLQKNLLSLFFELPQKSVKIGEEWSLDLNLITLDNNFICRDYFNTNKVLLKDIKYINGYPIATVSYNLANYVKGDKMTFFSSNFTETAIEVAFKGQGEFNIKKGKWVNLHFIAKTNSSGSTNARQSFYYHLQEVNNLPDTLIKLINL